MIGDILRIGIALHVIPLVYLPRTSSIIAYQKSSNWPLSSYAQRFLPLDADCYPYTAFELISQQTLTRLFQMEHFSLWREMFMTSIREIIGALPRPNHYSQNVIQPRISNSATGYFSNSSTFIWQQHSTIWTKIRSVLSVPFQLLGRACRVTLHTAGRVLFTLRGCVAILMIAILAPMIISWFRCAILYLRERRRHQRMKSISEDIERQSLRRNEVPPPGRSERQYQSFDPRTVRSNYSEAQTPLSSQQRQPASTQNLVPPVEGDLNIYIQHARTERIEFDQRRNPRLGQCWAKIVEGLDNTRTTSCMSTYYLNVSNLKTCDSSGLPDVLLRILIRAAHNFSPALGDVADVYLNPLRTNEYYNPLNSTLDPLPVKMATLSDGTYMVRSFFGAIHAILYHCIPPNQTLREYVQFFILFTRLLNRLLEPYLSILPKDIHPKASLLVCLSPRTDVPTSRAIIGFSAAGPTRDNIIHDRNIHLPVLKEVVDHNKGWLVGNCAEVETFGHLNIFEKSFSKQDCSTRLGMIGVGLTMDLKGLYPVRPCPQCAQLEYKVRSSFTVTLCLAPKRDHKRVERDQSGSEVSNLHEPVQSNGRFRARI